MENRIRWILSFVLMVLLISVVGCGGDGKTTSVPVKTVPAMEVKAEEVLNDYIRDVGTAEQKYKDKTIRVTGVVIATGQFKNSTNFFVTIGRNYVGGKSYVFTLNYPVDRVQEVNQLKAGDFIVAEGMFHGVVPQDDPTRIDVQLGVAGEQKTQKLENAPATSTPAAGVDKAPNTQGRITGTDVRIRSGPGINTTIMGYFQNGEVVTIQEVQEGWYKVARANGQVGWVAKSFIVN